MERFRIIIVGGGPAGLSAGARAAALDRKGGLASPSYVVLESFERHAQTIQLYQKGKLVMSEPSWLDLRSDLEFDKGPREEVLGNWQQGIESQAINVRFGATVKKITGARGNFVLTLENGASLGADNVVLAIGVNAKARKLGVSGEDLEGVLYQLDDADAYSEKTMLVVGAGDAAIENAIGLAQRNDVVLSVRKETFSKPKDENVEKINAKVAEPRSTLQIRYSTKIKKVTREVLDTGDPMLRVLLETPTGDETIDYDVILARLGGLSARGFVESCGVKFPGAADDAVPEVSRQYESNVPGLYIIGSLSGSPLIKQAMNQGYEVVEYLLGHEVEPIDHRPLRRILCGLPDLRDVDDILERFRSIVPMFREINPMAFREFIIESDLIISFPGSAELAEAEARVEEVRKAQPPSPKTSTRKVRYTRLMREGEVIFDVGEYGTSFYTIVSGSVLLEAPGVPSVQLTRGDFLGETSLLAGRPYTEKAIAGEGCVLVQTPRSAMLKLINSNPVVKQGIDWIFVVRELQRHFAPRSNARDLRNIASRVKLTRVPANGTIYREDDPARSVFMLRSGNVRLSRRVKDEEVLVAQLRTGQLIGEMGVMGIPKRKETATAMLASEVLELQRPEFLALSQRPDARLELVQAEASARIKDTARMAARPEAGSLMNFLVAKGLGEATNVLVIDDSLCVGCDNCEKACAETHGGISRLDRKAGPTFANVHIPVACRHCEQPHCMKECPTNAIRRAPTGEVFINDQCIGCEACQRNCPYGVIRMEKTAPSKPGLLSWLLAGLGPGPGEAPKPTYPEGAPAAGKAGPKETKAMKCDACMDLKHGPACVKACPTGAAIRISPHQLIDLVEERRP